METSLDRSMLNNTNREERIMDLIREFEVATDAMHRDYNRRDLGPELSEVLNRAALINGFMQRNKLNTNVQNQWNLIRNDLNTLAGYYTMHGTGTMFRRSPATQAACPATSITG
jgi:hypothetical protein